MVKQLVIFLTTFAILVSTIPAEAQRVENVPWIGFLHQGPGTKAKPRPRGFRQGLREVGYVEGHNITVEYRFAKGRRDRLAKFAAELVGLKLDETVSPWAG